MIECRGFFAFEFNESGNHAIVNGPAGDFLVSNQFDLTKMPDHAILIADRHDGCST